MSNLVKLKWAIDNDKTQKKTNTKLVDQNIHTYDTKIKKNLKKT